MTRNLADRLATLCNVAATLSDQELDILSLVAEGMAGGHATYGPMDVGRDPRDFERETLEEVRDGLVYVGAKLLQLGRK